MIAPTWPLETERLTLRQCVAEDLVPCTRCTPTKLSSAGSTTTSARSTARPLLRFAFETLGLHRVVGTLDARNSASARVLEKLGMRREGYLVENEWVKGEWQSEVVYAILDRERRDAHRGEGWSPSPAT